MAGLQDATTFQEARDVLLRHYYPVLRTFSANRSSNTRTPEEIESWAIDLLHSGSRSSAALFCENVWREKAGASAEQVENFGQQLQRSVLAARKDTAATPYERVGRVLDWLKQARSAQSAIGWEHSGLRQWMQGLLMDFTLADAKKQPGALLDKPELHYEKMVQSWQGEKTGVPFNAVWRIKGERWFLKNSAPGNIAEFSPGSGRITETVFNLRAKLAQEAVPTMALMTHAVLGATRQMRPSWRDVTDYGVLHPLLVLTEETFDKKVWIDFLQHGGNAWSSQANQDVWSAWQDGAATSYQIVLQTYTGSTPNALVHNDMDPGVNSLKAEARSPLPLDWYKAFSQLAERFAYLNQAPEFEALAQSKLSPKKFEQFQQESRERVGQSLILALIELPEELAQKNVFNMPEWFHARLQEEMTAKARLELPEGLLDETQAPSLY